ncbi:hypothetical protein R4315_08255 [Rhodococcus oxybenzonivorans]|uniref:Uncharacterized protein n=2 Tax=Nocardiaceae TaxID=85025 RepID=A0A2S2BYX5_9NOCA|nr:MULTISPECIES: hypothetical protein [Rhodococcus]AWK73845.1 hypothetical protein CBI38_22050 [Rhodococcus oxybenzonivorans]MDV7246539.1 hypothetical protein [Rhodococcus oxybenzonivorans]MDV7264535.1 hypothetical protein [Rhodococcus oxybenzonivorans]MDV7278161.1 hypothetical protein [Rhodococcus oxybenzonivorans]MDV7337526.1 hypothetical protein [Rhodococcus oxybenzonivorans]
MMSLTLGVVAGTVELLAQTPSTPSGPEFGKASPIGLVVILALLAGVVLLVRSMNKQLKNLPETFEPDHPEPDQEADEGTDRGALHGDNGTTSGPSGPTDNPPKLQQ